MYLINSKECPYVVFENLNIHFWICTNQSNLCWILWLVAGSKHKKILERNKKGKRNAIASALYLTITNTVKTYNKFTIKLTILKRQHFFQLLQVAGYSYSVTYNNDNKKSIWQQRRSLESGHHQVNCVGGLVEDRSCCV